MTLPKTIGVVMAALAGYYWGGILAGMQQVARQRGARLVVIQGTPQDVQLYGLASDIVDGWIAVHNDQGIQYLAAQGRPLVTATMHVPGLACPTVLADNRAGTAAAVRHLIAHGHSRIVFVGWLAHSSIQQRFEGYCDAFAEHCIPFDPRIVIRVDDNWDINGRVGAQQLIDPGHALYCDRRWHRSECNWHTGSTSGGRISGSRGCGRGWVRRYQSDPVH